MSTPAQVGSYVLSQAIGAGGMGVVYGARRLDDARPYAVKLPTLQDPDDAHARATVLREIQAQARLSHPHITPVTDWGEQDGQLWLAMPRLELDERVRPERLGVADRLSLVDQLLDALSYAHDRGVIHRDVKPQNLLIEPSSSGPKLYLTDFGVADLSPASRLGAIRASQGRGGAVLGTPNFMAPEQARGEGVGPEADLYAVGVLLHLWFTGELPFVGRSTLDVVIKHLREPPPPLISYDGAYIPEGLAEITERLLCKDPLGRYPSASACRAALVGVSVQPGHADAMLQELTPPAGLPAVETLPYGAQANTTQLVPIQPPQRPGRIGDTQLMLVAPVAQGAAVGVRGAAAPIAEGVLRRMGARVEREAAGVFIGWLTGASARGRAAELACSFGALGCEVVLGASVAEARLLLGIATAGAVQISTSLGLIDGFVRSGTPPVLLPAPRPRAAVCEWLHADLIDGLLARAAAVRERSAVDVLTIAGSPGMGKTTLVRQLGRRLKAEGWVVLEGAAVGEVNGVLQPIRDAISDWIGAPPAVDSTLAAALAVHAAPGLGPQLHGQLGRLVGLRSGPLSGHRVGDIERAQDFGLVVRLMSGLASSGPVCLMIDDLDQADGDTAKLLDVLAVELSARPLLVVTTARRATGAAVVRVEALDAARAWRLLEALTGTERSRLSAGGPAPAGGIPGHLVELARLWSIESAGASLPSGESLEAMLSVRLDGLAPVDADALQRAAVLGRWFFAPEFATVLGAPLQSQDASTRTRLRTDSGVESPSNTAGICAGPRLGLSPQPRTRARSDSGRELLGVISPERQLSALQRQGLLIPLERSALPGVTAWRFVHELARMHVLACVPAELARTIRRKAAGWLEGQALRLDPAGLVRLADHWAMADAPARSAAWLYRAGRLAESAGGLPQAAVAFSRALALLDQMGPAPVEATVYDGVVLPVDVPGLMLANARAHLEAGHLDDAVRCARRAIEAREPHRGLVLAEAHRVLAKVALSRGENQRCLDHANAGLATLGAQGDRVMRALLHSLRGWVLGYILGRNDEGRAEVERALELVEGLDTPGIQAKLFSSLGAIELRSGNWDRQLWCNEQALLRAEQQEDPVEEARASVNLGVCYSNRGRLELAAAHAARARDLGSRLGLESFKILGLNNLGVIRIDQGRFDEGHRVLILALDVAERTGADHIFPELLSHLARGRAYVGEMPAAFAFAERARAAACAQRSPVGTMIAGRIWGIIEACAGQPGRARTHLLEALALPVEDAYEIVLTRLVLDLVEGPVSDPVAQRLVELGANVAVEVARWGHGLVGSAEG